jgi:hypothetical protein
MYKVVWLLKRKDGMSHEAFRKHFEESHVKLAQKYIGHLFAEYRRNYVTQIFDGGDPREPDGGFAPREWEYDLISEWGLHDEAAFAELNRIMADPEISRIFKEDEDKFVHRKSMAMIPCDLVL